MYEYIILKTIEKEQNIKKKILQICKKKKKKIR